MGYLRMGGPSVQGPLCMSIMIGVLIDKCNGPKYNYIPLN